MKFKPMDARERWMPLIPAVLLLALVACDEGGSAPGAL